MPKECNKIYTVGQMAKICHISPELLRYFDKQGIFHPITRDPNNNYRCYSEEQLQDLLLIMELRRIGLPYSTISDLMDGRDLSAIKNMLEKNLFGMRREIDLAQKKYDQLVDLLLRISSSMNIPKGSTTVSEPEMKIEFIPERFVLFTRYLRDIDVELNYIQHYIELLKLVDQYELTCSGPITLVYHDHFSKMFHAGEEEVLGDLEINIAVASSNPECKQLRRFGGFSAATFTCAGHYREIENGYYKMKQWAENLGHQLSGISFQELIVGRTITSREENFVTKVFLPLDTVAI